MSRTIRRTTGEKPRWLEKKYGITHINGESYYTEEELARKIVKHYSDAGYSSGPSKWFKNREQSIHRMVAKQELSKFWKDNDYEVQIRARYLADYWD